VPPGSAGRVAPAERGVRLLVLAGGRYEERDRSAVVGVERRELEAMIGSP
jgi:hypothetical protein